MDPGSLLAPWVPDAVGVKGTQCGSSWRETGVQERRGPEEAGPGRGGSQGKRRRQEERRVLKEAVPGRGGAQGGGARESRGTGFGSESPAPPS